MDYLKSPNNDSYSTVSTSFATIVSLHEDILTRPYQ